MPATARVRFSKFQTAAPPPGSLQPYTPSAAKPWNALRVAHVYRRLGFGATYEQIQQGLQLGPSALIDQLLDDASNLGSPLPPYWAGYTSDDYVADPNLVFVHRDELRRKWMSAMIQEGIQAKMALFWHNHFVTELNEVGCNNYLWDYFTLIHEQAFANFRTFARLMGQNPAMLAYLNGNQNRVGSPNENYARELMELFTMGESNGYTQNDIVEMARALTGWRSASYACMPAYFDNAYFDNTPKTIFGQTTNFNFNSAHNLIFSVRPTQVSQFITGKLYKFFLYQKPDADVHAGLAETFRNSNWELLPVLKQLFKSEHFFEDHFMNAEIKSPLETLLPIWKMAGVVPDQHIPEDWWGAVAYWSYQLGQDIFNPPNVAGWPGYHKWLNESTLTARWNYASAMAYRLTLVEEVRSNLRNIAIDLSNDSNDPAVIVPLLVAFFTGQQLDPIQLQAAIINFKANIPENYFEDGSWTLAWSEAPYQIVNMLYYLVRLPEFQLN